MTHEEKLKKLKLNGAIWISPVIKEADTCDCCIIATKHASFNYNLEDNGCHYGQYSNDEQQNIDNAKARYAERLERIRLTK